MLTLVGILIQLIGQTLCWFRLAFRSTQAIMAENLFLRRRLALYVERGVKSRRVDPVTRISLALLSRLFDWRDAVVVVRPETMIRWHRAGWKLFWRLKSRPGRPPIPKQLQALIRRMARENPSWGEERIANELLLKLGIHVSPRIVRKYLPRGYRAGQEATCAGRHSCNCTHRESLPAISWSPSP
jgi:putative transposase